MADYGQERIDAYKDIAAAGAVISLVQSVSSGVYNPVTEVYPTTEETEILHVALITGYKEEFINNTTIKFGDKKFLIPALLEDLSTIITIAQEDLIVVGNRTWKIISIDIVEPDGIPILYKIQGRE